MFPYAEETFTDDEVEVLRRYVTNVEGPVFALVNLPEVVKGALFARYSRSAKSLRRLFLDEFVGELDVTGDAGVDATVGIAPGRGALRPCLPRVRRRLGRPTRWRTPGVRAGVEHAHQGARVGSAHGLPRAVDARMSPYDSRLSTGHYRYHRDPEVLESSVGARYVGGHGPHVRRLRRVARPSSQTWLSKRFPQAAAGDSDFVYRQSIRAKALDALRGLLPAALAVERRACTAPGSPTRCCCCACAPIRCPRRDATPQLMLVELRKVIPSFLQRVDIPERGRGVDRVPGGDLGPDRARSWPACGPMPMTARTSTALQCAAGGLGPRGRGQGHRGHVLPPHVVLGPEVAASGPGARGRGPAVDHAGLRGRADQPAPPPGRAFERTGYRFDVVSDYGAFRDLQRHRMLTIEWQDLGPGARLRDARDRGGSGVRRTLRVARWRARPRLYDVMTPCARPGALRRGPCLPCSLRHADERPRSHAHGGVALRATGPPRVPDGGTGDAPAHRRDAGHRAHRRGHGICGPRIIRPRATRMPNDAPRIGAKRSPPPDDATSRAPPTRDGEKSRHRRDQGRCAKFLVGAREEPLESSRARGLLCGQSQTPLQLFRRVLSAERVARGGLL